MKFHPITPVIWLVLFVYSAAAAPPSDAASPTKPQSPATSVPLAIEVLSSNPQSLIPSPFVKSSPAKVATETDPSAIDSTVVPPPALRLGSPASSIPPPPDGWELDASTEVPQLPHWLETSPGQGVLLLIRPPLLVPKTNDTTVISLIEPGFSPALGSQQSSTTGALLTDTMHELDSSASNLDAAIAQLENLLLSMPSSQQKTAPPPAPSP